MIALDTCCVSKCSGDCWVEYLYLYLIGLAKVHADFAGVLTKFNCLLKPVSLRFSYNDANSYVLNYVCSPSQNAAIVALHGVLSSRQCYQVSQHMTHVIRENSLLIGYLTISMELFTLSGGKASALQRSQDFQFTRSRRIAPPFHFLPPNFIILQRGCTWIFNLESFPPRSQPKETRGGKEDWRKEQKHRHVLQF